jgi:integrase
VRTAWKRICTKAGLAVGARTDIGITPHDLRRTLGTLVAASGANSATISAVLGHIDANSAKSYIHLSAEIAREAVEVVMKRLNDAA